MTEKDLNYLKDIGIKTAIDLRSKEELNEIVSVFETNSIFDVYHDEIFSR